MKMIASVRTLKPYSDALAHAGILHAHLYLTKEPHARLVGELKHMRFGVGAHEILRVTNASDENGINRTATEVFYAFLCSHTLLPALIDNFRSLSKAISHVAVVDEHAEHCCASLQ